MILQAFKANVAIARDVIRFETADLEQLLWGERCQAGTSIRMARRVATARLLRAYRHMTKGEFAPLRALELLRSGVTGK